MEKCIYLIFSIICSRILAGFMWIIMFFVIINRFLSVSWPTTLFLFKISYRRGDYYGRCLITYKSMPEFFGRHFSVASDMYEAIYTNVEQIRLLVANIRTWMRWKTNNFFNLGAMLSSLYWVILVHRYVAQRTGKDPWGSGKWADSVHSLKAWPSPLHGPVIARVDCAYQVHLAHNALFWGLLAIDLSRGHW